MGELKDLKQDRFLRKDASQSDQTKGASYAAANPAPKRGDDALRKIGRPKGSEEDDGAPNVLTGTVITSCLIQTSALPSRAELEGNDLTLFDDTYSQGGTLIGDTSRIVFTHGSAKQGAVITSGFILQKRASTDNTYDNVLELFSPDNDPHKNFVFIGRMGTGAERNISLVEIAPDHRTAIGDADGYVNGIFRVRVSRDGEDLDYRDGVYIFDRGTESSSRSGTVNWLVAAGEGGQVRLSYMANRDDNPLTESLYDLYISSVGFTFFGVPTAYPGVDGRLWSDGGVLKISNASSALTIQQITGAGAINVTDGITAITTTALDQAFTLANGTNGQVKYIYIASDGGSAVITPTLGNGYSTITLNGDGDGVTLVFQTGVGWTCVGENSATFA